MIADQAHSGKNINLPEPVRDSSMSVEKALDTRRSTRNFSQDHLTLEHVGQMLWAAQGITETRRNFRTAPSAGATFPLDIYLVSGDVEGLKAGVYRYVPKSHSISKTMDEDRRDDLHSSALGQGAVRQAPASIIIAAEFEKTVRVYGQRGRQYVYMEVGHAGQNIHLQAEALGLGTVVIGAFDEKGVSRVLDLPREIVPLYIMPFGKPR